MPPPGKGKKEEIPRPPPPPTESEPTPMPPPGKPLIPVKPDPGPPIFISGGSGGSASEVTGGGPVDVGFDVSPTPEPAQGSGYPEAPLPELHFVGGLVVFTGSRPAPDEAPSSVMTSVDRYYGNEMDTWLAINQLRAEGCDVVVIPVGSSSTSAVDTLPTLSPSPSKVRLDPNYHDYYVVYQLRVTPPRLPDDPVAVGDQPQEPTRPEGGGEHGGGADSISPNVGSPSGSPFAAPIGLPGGLVW